MAGAVPSTSDALGLAGMFCTEERMELKTLAKSKIGEKPFKRREWGKMMQPQGKGEELVLCWEVWFMSRTQLVFTWVLFFWLFLTIDVFGSLDDGLNAFLSRLCFHLPKLRETKLPRLSCANSRDFTRGQYPHVEL